MNQLPSGFYDYLAGYYMQNFITPGKEVPTPKEQLVWYNQQFPEATWHQDSNTGNIWPEFKSPEHETMFMVKWS